MSVAYYGFLCQYVQREKLGKSVTTLYSCTHADYYTCAGPGRPLLFSMCSCGSFIFACALQCLALRVEEGLLFFTRKLCRVFRFTVCWMLCRYQLHSSFRGAICAQYVICTVESSPSHWSCIFGYIFFVQNVTVQNRSYFFFLQYFIVFCTYW
jgi:hypothetical protein